jgi:hypothetical protein
MAAFYNEGDQAIYDSGQFYIPQEKYRLSYTAPITEDSENSIGIPNTNSFRNFSNSDNRYFSSGNAFGYGSPIKPGGSYGAYDSINYTGGLDGNIQQYGVGRQFEDPSASPIGETYSYKKTVPGYLRVGAGFIPFGNTALNFLENRMNTNRDQPPGTYRIGGLDESMKGYYDNLAGSGMLFDGPGGVKTLTGKNFTGKGYLEGQIELAKSFGFDTMTDEEINEAIAAEGKRHADKYGGNKGFKFKQMLEASQMFKTNQVQEENKQKMKDLAASESRRESERQYDPNIHGGTNYGLGDKGQQSYSGDAVGASGLGFGVDATTGGPVSNKTGKGRTGYGRGGIVSL